MSMIEHLLTVAQKRLAELEGEAEHLRALIRLHTGSAQGQNTKQAASDAKGRSRGVSSAWRPLGAHLVQSGELHLNDLEAFAVQNDLPFTRTQIRNQMHNWKRSGFVESPRQSVFTITPLGVKEMSDSAASNGNGADHESAPSPEIENRDEPRSPSTRLDLLNRNEALCNPDIPMQGMKHTNNTAPSFNHPTRSLAARKLREWREDKKLHGKKLRQAEVAAMLDPQCQQKMISLWEHARAEPSRKRAMKLAKISGGRVLLKEWDIEDREPEAAGEADAT